MEDSSNQFTKRLPVKHISVDVGKYDDYIIGRKEGTIKSLDTGFPKLNDVFLNGIEWGRIVTIPGRSGSGKSLLLEQLKRNMVDLNPDQNFDVLSFDWEMTTKDQIGRHVSAIARITSKTMYSSTEPIHDSDLWKVRKAASAVAKYPFYLVELFGNVSEIYDTIMDFVTTRKHAKRNRGIIVTIDHVLLTKGQEGEAERIKLANLYAAVMQLRKTMEYLGIPFICILLAQLNRNIEQNDRVINPRLHYPGKQDIFGGDVIWQGSDYVLIPHKPALIPGMSFHYGPPRGTRWPKGLPVFSPEDPKRAMVYWHLVKNRFGETADIMMVDNFKYASYQIYEVPDEEEPSVQPKSAVLKNKTEDKP